MERMICVSLSTTGYNSQAAAFKWDKRRKMQQKHSLFPYRYSCLRKSEQDVQSENCVLCQAVPSKAIKLETRYERAFDPQLPTR